MLDPKEIKTSGNNPRRLDSEVHKLQDYLRDAAQYIFDTYGNEALQRLTDDFDGCMKEFHDHRMEVFKKLQTPEGVAMIRELALGKIRDRANVDRFQEKFYKDLRKGRTVEAADQVEPLEWFSPQRNDHLRAHCYLGRKDGSYTAYGIRPHSDGTWGVYSGEKSKTLTTVGDCKVFVEGLRNRADYSPWMDWDKEGVPNKDMLISSPRVVRHN